MLVGRGPCSCFFVLWPAAQQAVRQLKSPELGSGPEWGHYQGWGALSGGQARPVPPRMGFPCVCSTQEAARGSPKAERRRSSGPAC